MKRTKQNKVSAAICVKQLRHGIKTMRAGKTGTSKIIIDGSHTTYAGSQNVHIVSHAAKPGKTKSTKIVWKAVTPVILLSQAYLMFIYGPKEGLAGLLDTGDVFLSVGKSVGAIFVLAFDTLLFLR